MDVRSYQPNLGPSKEWPQLSLLFSVVVARKTHLFIGDKLIYGVITVLKNIKKLGNFAAFVDYGLGTG